MRTLDADASADGTIIRGAGLVDGFETPAGDHGLRRVGLHFEVLIPVALALKGGGRFTGHGRLMERPQEPYFRLFTEEGIAWSLENGVLAVEGGCARRRVLPVYHRPALRPPTAGGGQRACPHHRAGEPGLCGHDPGRPGPIRRLGGVRRGPALPGAGEPGVPPPGSGHRGDWSNAAFWFAAAFLGHRVDVEGLNPRSVQGDRVIGEQLARLTQPGPAELDVSQCPDLVPLWRPWPHCGRGDDRHRQRRPPAHQGERPAGLCDAGAQRPGGRCGGARRPSGAPGQGAAGGASPSPATTTTVSP